VQRVLDTEGQEVRLYCYSQVRARKEESIAERFAQRFEAALQALADGLSRPRTTKRIDQALGAQRAAERKEPRRRQHYHIEILPDASGEQAQAIR
jgi:hypothetical protein